MFCLHKGVYILGWLLSILHYKNYNSWNLILTDKSKLLRISVLFEYIYSLIICSQFDFHYYFSYLLDFSNQFEKVEKRERRLQVIN